LFDGGVYGMLLGDGNDLLFWHSGTYVLGQLTNGYTNVISSFVTPAEGPHALNNGVYGNFAFTAFQVLLVRPVEGLCASLLLNLTSLEFLRCEYAFDQLVCDSFAHR
jgi:hypothetical protein